MLIGCISKSSHFKVRIFNCLLFAIPLIPLAAQDLQYETYMTGAQEALRFSGAVLVAKDGKVLYSDGIGMADAAACARNDVKNKYLLGSITKQFTAAAILQLAEKKKLTLEDPLSKYFPSYPKPAADRVKLVHLLNHSSGIPDFTDIPEIDSLFSKPVLNENVLNLFQNHPLLFEPGSQWRYSNSNFILLGLVLEKVSGEKYSDYMKKHIFRKAGMKNSGFPPGPMFVTGQAVGYTEDANGEMVPARVLDSSWPFSGGGLYSTVHDMFLWDKALGDKAILSGESLECMFTPIRTPFGFGYGFGWEIDTLFLHPTASHGGLIDGFQCHFLRFLDEPFCVVVLGNNDLDAGRISRRIALGLAAIANAEPYDVPVCKNPVEIDSGNLDDYCGVYGTADGQILLVTEESSRLYFQMLDRAKIPLHAEAEDKFFLATDNSSTITFLRRGGDRVTGLMEHKDGMDQSALRIEGEKADRILGTMQAADIDPETFRKFEGEYEVAPGFAIEFFVRDGRFFTRATGQPEMELFPRSETEFFLKAAGGSVLFVQDDTGRVTGIVIRQGGREIPAKRIGQQ